MNLVKPVCGNSLEEDKLDDLNEEVLMTAIYPKNKAI